MEITIDVVKPNLHIREGIVYFGVESPDFLNASRSVDEVVKRHIGELKVRERDVKIVKYDRPEKTEDRFAAPLNSYLNALEVREQRGFILGITNGAANLFGLDYVISARTSEKPKDIVDWLVLQEDLAEPEKTFDKWEKNWSVCIDRKRTLEAMRKLHEQLNLKIPDNGASFYVARGNYLSRDNTAYLGAIMLTQLKATDDAKIKETKHELVEKLKTIDGPRLSLDAQAILGQAMSLFEDAPELVQKYGDVLVSQDWRSRLFRLDP